MRPMRVLAHLAIVSLVTFGCEEMSSSGDEVVPEKLSGKADFAGIPSEDTDWQLIADRCAAPEQDEPVITSGDFRWGYSREEMAKRFLEMYESDKRLSKRAYYDPVKQAYVLSQIDAWGGDVLLPNRLIENVRRHIEKALVRGYAEHVFFPDMGHTHLFIPHDRWDEVYAGRDVHEFSAMYSELFDDPELSVLYHTAEQLQMVDDEDALLEDRMVRWRFFTRNVVGDNAYLSRIELLHDPEHVANTSRSMPGHRYRGSGFNISASKDGCFPYVHDGIMYWFDISLSDLPPDPDAPDAFR